MKIINKIKSIGYSIKVIIGIALFTILLGVMKVIEGFMSFYDKHML